MLTAVVCSGRRRDNQPGAAPQAGFGGQAFAWLAFAMVLTAGTGPDAAASCRRGCVS